MQNVEQFLCKMVWGQLRSMGFFTEKHTAADLHSESRLHALYRRWFEETVAILARNHYLKKAGDTYTVADPALPDMDALWKEWDSKKAACLENSNMKAMVALVDATLRVLPDIISGKVPATDILFPDSSMELVEGIYKHNQVADYFNEVLADTLAAYMQERLKQDPGTSLRVLEIGAGTGGTSSMVFQKLKPYQEHVQEYCYTDVSRAFLLHAEKEYSPENPFLTYHIFNVEETVAGQGIDAGGYDVVIAANVLHATKNIRQTLRNAKMVLKSKGLLLLNEINNNNLFSHLTFGLLEGWWRYEDPELRISGCPALTPESWCKVLKSEGFRDVSFMAEEEHELGQQIIAAESDGVIRHKQWLGFDAVAAKQTTTKKEVEEHYSNRMPQAIQAKVIKNNAPQENADANQAVSEDFLAGETLKFVKDNLAKTIKLSPERIESETSFEKYGIDSILQVHFIRELEKITGELPKTILFEHSNAQELVEYLMKNHADKLRGWISMQKNEVPKHETPIYSNATEPTPLFFVKKERFLRPQEVVRYEQEHSTTERGMDDIAIIGISGRYPLSNTLDELWEHLKAGHNCITEVPHDRWQKSLTQRLELSRNIDKRYYGGFLEQIDRFDYQLFETNRQHVMEMTPEVRLFLEVVWEAFEDAGYGKYRLNELQNSYQKGIGVFVGNMYNQYFWSIPSLEQAVLSSNGTDWHIANRVSHFFNLTGPSLAVNSACSSSLSAIHFACESLKQQSCSMAMAGGINLTLDRSKYDVLQRARLLGSGNESKSFGVGDGLIPGEGVGTVLLKPLSKAIHDHDHIYAVIKSSCANHSGGRQMYTAPDPKQQAQLIANSIQQSGIDPMTIGYIESAANGSELGDPIEVIALQQVFARYTDKKQFCALGSVKSNLGHLEAASGMSQFSKVLLQMKYATLVPTINAKPMNPNIKLENTAFYLQEKTERWNQLVDSQNGKNLPRRSMINSFGAGGSYANLIIEEYMGDTIANFSGPDSSQEFLFVFSAKTKWSLIKYLENMQLFLQKDSTMDIGNVACSLQKVDHGLEYRVAIVASSVRDLIEKVDSFQKTRESSKELNIYTSFDLESTVDTLDALGVIQLLERKDLRQLALQWGAGAEINFSPLYKDKESSWIELPYYAFDHHVKFSFQYGNGEAEDLIDEGQAMDSSSEEALPAVTNFKEEHLRLVKIYEYDEPYLKDHKMNGEQVLIGATHGSLAINAFFNMFPEQNRVIIRKLNYVEPIVVKKYQKVEVRVDTSQKDAAGDFQVVYRHYSSDAWKLTAAGQFKKDTFKSKKINVQRIKDTLEEVQNLDWIYECGMGVVEWGDIYKTITRLYRGHDQILAKFVIHPNSLEYTKDYILNPLMTNTVYLAMFCLLEHVKIEGGYLPFGINEIQFERNKAFTSGWLNIKLVKNSGEMMIFDVDAINEEFEVGVRYLGYSLKRSQFTGKVCESDDSYTSSVTLYESQKTAVPSYSDDVSHPDVIYGKILKYLTGKLKKISTGFAKIPNMEVNLMNVGLDSSQLIAMTREIEREANIELNPTLFFEYPTIKELAEFFSTEHKRAFVQLLAKESEQAQVSDSAYKQKSEDEEETMISRTQSKGSISDIRKEFPELIHLNGRHQGRPVFWLHGGLGGVEIYQTIAQKSQRPFYGIQARGYMNNRSPLNGIEKMASYYIDIIRSVQVEGPYDLGGYSLGGMLAYEITRQLQHAGQEVNTIVMIDSPYSPKFKEKKPSFKTLVLQTINTMLASMSKAPKKLPQNLINREEVNLNLEDEEFLKRLIDLAKTRGLIQAKAQIRNQIQKNVKTQRAYEFQDYIVLPLPNPGELNCYYLRNKSGVFFGNLEPYLTTPNDKIFLDHILYWEEWERQIPKFHMLNVDSSNHMMMLSEANASEAILEFCQKLYSETGVDVDVDVDDLLSCPTKTT